MNQDYGRALSSAAADLLDENVHTIGTIHLGPGRDPWPKGFTPPERRRGTHLAHRQITELCAKGRYADAELVLQNAPTQYRAAVSLCRYLTRLKYKVTAKHNLLADEQELERIEASTGVTAESVGVQC